MLHNYFLFCVYFKNIEQDCNLCSIHNDPLIFLYLKKYDILLFIPYTDIQLSSSAMSPCVTNILNIKKLNSKIL